MRPVFASDEGPSPSLAPDRSIVARTVFDAWDSSVAVLSADGTIEVVNEAWERFAVVNGGVGDVIGVGVNYLEVCERAAGIEPTAAAALGGLQQVLAGVVSEYTLEYPCHAPGEQRWFRLRARPIAVAGEMLLLVIHDNVSDRTRLQHDVRAGSLLLDQVDAAVVVTDLVGVVELWSPAAERLYGWTAGDAIGRPLQQLIGPVGRYGVAHDFIAEMAATGAWEGELTVVRAEGSTFPAHVRTAYARDVVGEPTGMVSVSLDLSVRAAMQEQLARSNRELKAITDSIGDGLCVLDVDGRITYINPRGQRCSASTSPKRSGCG
jgi:PAS domain S-box-containing protein